MATFSELAKLSADVVAKVEDSKEARPEKQLRPVFPYSQQPLLCHGLPIVPVAALMPIPRPTIMPIPRPEPPPRPLIQAVDVPTWGMRRPWTRGEARGVPHLGPAICR